MNTIELNGSCEWKKQLIRIMNLSRRWWKSSVVSGGREETSRVLSVRFNMLTFAYELAALFFAIKVKKSI
jgi:hypothetical protein